MDDQTGKKPSILFIGHLAIDRTIRFKKDFKPSLGGSVSFGSLAISKYLKKSNVRIISHIGNLNFNKKLLRKLKRDNISLEGILWSETYNTTFMLDYLDHSRKLTLEKRSPDLKLKDIPQHYVENPPQIVVLVPLCNEISHDYIKKILKVFPNALIGIDVQGFIRKVDAQGVISYTPDDNLIGNMKNIINLIGPRLILKGSEIEMQLISGRKDYHEIMDYFRSFNNHSIFIMTLGEQGSWLVKDTEILLKVPAFKPKRVRDETGAGDVYLAIFLLEYLLCDKNWDSVRMCAYKASAAASYLIEQKGTNGVKTKKKIMKRLNRKNYIA